MGDHQPWLPDRLSAPAGPGDTPHRWPLAADGAGVGAGFAGCAQARRVPCPSHESVPNKKAATPPCLVRRSWHLPAFKQRYPDIVMPGCFTRFICPVNFTIIAGESIAGVAGAVNLLF